MTHNFNNSGSFHNSTLIQGSTLTGLTIHIGALPVAPDRRQELADAVALLRDMLVALPPGEADRANLLIEDTQRLVNEATKPQPSPNLLSRFGRAMREGAGDLVSAAPKVLDAAERIVALAEKWPG